MSAGSQDLASMLACPNCRGDLAGDRHAFMCPTCDRRYPIEDGIPVFADESVTAHDELDHLHGSRDHAAGRPDSHKAGQAAYYDRDAMAEFEIERPEGAPAFYRFLLSEKFRRSTQAFGDRLDGWTALTVCGGSGMDAEFLARAGASVISSDISFASARRTRTRAERHGVAIMSIVADVEHLPFRDHSVDLVYVHDGLHHLAAPEAGIAEMARVAARALSITEPARAAATQLAVRFGLALSREEAGNEVARLDPGEIAVQLADAGFTTASAERYAMYYRHHPGPVMEFLSRPVVFPLTIATWRIGNALLGRIGNKLSVTAVR
jgi:uncharacterized protein YbaR (Trm112 family)